MGLKPDQVLSINPPFILVKYRTKRGQETLWQIRILGPEKYGSHRPYAKHANTWKLFHKKSACINFAMVY